MFAAGRAASTSSSVALMPDNNPVPRLGIASARLELTPATAARILVRAAGSTVSPCRPTPPHTHTQGLPLLLSASPPLHLPVLACLIRSPPGEMASLAYIFAINVYLPLSMCASLPGSRSCPHMLSICLFSVCPAHPPSFLVPLLFHDAL